MFIVNLISNNEQGNHTNITNSIFGRSLLSHDKRKDLVCVRIKSSQRQNCKSSCCRRCFITQQTWAWSRLSRSALLSCWSSCLVGLWAWTRCDNWTESSVLLSPQHSIISYHASIITEYATKPHRLTCCYTDNFKILTRCIIKKCYWTKKTDSNKEVSVTSASLVQTTQRFTHTWQKPDKTRLQHI